MLPGTQEYRLTLYLGVLSALELEEHPENVSRNFLTVILSPAFLPGQTVDPKRSFTAGSVGVGLIADIPTGQSRATLEAVLARVPELQRRDPTFLGLALVHITVPIAGHRDSPYQTPRTLGHQRS
jgi:hypothetical protein